MKSVKKMTLYEIDCLDEIVPLIGSVTNFIYEEPKPELKSEKKVDRPVQKKRGKSSSQKPIQLSRKKFGFKIQIAGYQTVFVIFPIITRKRSLNYPLLLNHLLKNRRLKVIENSQGVLQFDILGIVWRAAIIKQSNVQRENFFLETSQTYPYKVLKTDGEMVSYAAKKHL